MIREMHKIFTAKAIIICNRRKMVSYDMMWEWMQIIFARFRLFAKVGEYATMFKTKNGEGSLLLEAENTFAITKVYFVVVEIN